MTVEYVRDFFKVDQVVGEELSQVIVEGDIIISESKPEIAKVLNVSGMVVVNSREVIQDRVMVEGGVRYNVLYIAEENEQLIESTEAEIGFTQYLEIPGAKPNMTSVLKCQVEHIEYDIVNNRKLNIKTVLNLEGQVNQVLQLEEGDTVLFYTDGLIEIDRKHPNHFNEDNLKEYLRGIKNTDAPEMVNYMFDLYYTILDDKQMIDDVTVLAMKIEGKVETAEMRDV